MSESRKYRTFTPEQKIEIVVAGLRGDRPVRDVCREYEISEALYYQWRERLLEGGKTALATPRDRKPPEPAELAQAPVRRCRFFFSSPPVRNPPAVVRDGLQRSRSRAAPRSHWIRRRTRLDEDRRRTGEASGTCRAVSSHRSYPSRRGSACGTAKRGRCGRSPGMIRSCRAHWGAGGGPGEDVGANGCSAWRKPSSCCGSSRLVNPRSTVLTVSATSAASCSRQASGSTT